LRALTGLERLGGQNELLLEDAVASAVARINAGADQRITLAIH